MNNQLTAKNVEKVLLDCLYKPEELDDEHTAPKGAVIVEGVIQSFGFHPGRLESHKEDIKGKLQFTRKLFGKIVGL